MPNPNTRRMRSPRVPLDRWLWKWCSAKEAVVGLLILNMVVLALSYLLPQAPAHAHLDPASYSDWLSAIQVRLKGWTTLLDTLGLLRISNALWYRVLQAALAFLLLISLGNELGQQFQKPRIKPPDTFFDGPESTRIDTTLPAPKVAHEMRKAMGSFLRLVREETANIQGQTRSYLYASRGTWAMGGSLVIHVGLLLMVVGLAINGRWGWRQPGVQLVAGQPTPVGPASVHQLQLAKDGVSSTSALLLRGEHRLLIALNHPTPLGAFRYQLTGEDGPLVRVTAQTADQAPLTLHEYRVRPDPVESLDFAFASSADAEEADRLFIVSQDKVVGRIDWLNRREWPAQAPRFRLSVFREDGKTLVGKAEVAPGSASTATIGRVTYALDVTRFAIVDVAYQPGRWAVGVGIILLLVGLLSEWVPRQQVWGLVEPQVDGTSVKIRTERRGIHAPSFIRRDEMLAYLRSQIGETG